MRPLVFISFLVAIATLFGSPAEAQRKKAPKKPAVTRPKPAPAAPAVPEPPPAEPAPEEPAAPVEAAPEPLPAPPPPPPPAPISEPPPVAPAPRPSVRRRARPPVVEEDEDKPVRRRRSRRPSRANVDDEEPAEEESEKDDSEDKDADKDPEEEEEEQDSDSDSDVDVDLPKGARRTKPYMLDAALVLRGFQRHFSYMNDRDNDLPNYDLGGAPAFGLDVGFYPLKNKKGSLSGGITGSFEYAVGLGTTYHVQTPEQEGTKSTTSMAWALGLRGLYTFGAGMSNLIGVGLEYGFHSFVVDHPPPMPGNANIPGVEYKFIRPNINGRLSISNKMALLGQLGYLSISSAGEIVSADYFRGATSSASGLDIGLGVGYEIRMSPKGAIKYLEVRPMLTFRRYSFRFSPAEEDPFYASGATDDYLGLNIGIATRL